MDHIGRNEGPEQYCCEEEVVRLNIECYTEKTEIAAPSENKDGMEKIQLERKVSA